MQRTKYTSGLGFEELAKYSRAVRDGDWLFVSGTIGVDAQTGKIPDSAEQQARAIFATFEKVLAQAEMSIEDVVQSRVFLTDARYLDEVVRVLTEKFDTVRPTNTTVVCQLPVPAAKVEIEITAKKRKG